jgi:hypothetical protein
MEKTYYDKQILPILHDAENSDYKATICVFSPNSNLSSHHMDVSTEQLEKILHILNEGA